jgi:Uncharacterized conserved protein (DUF2303)
VSETNAIGELVIKAATNTPATLFDAAGGREFMIHRNDFTFKDVTPPNAAEILKPQIVTAMVELQDSTSFIDYVNRFQNDDSVIFADMYGNGVLGIIDYHGEPVISEPDTSGLKKGPTPELCAHRVKFGLPFSLEWATWMGKNGRLMSHKEFATFLEENSIDVLPLARREGLATSEEDADMPDTLLELTRSLQVTNKVNFNSVVRHGDYERVEFSKEADATSKGRSRSRSASLSTSASRL